MSDEIQTRFPTLNVLLCCANVLESRRTESADELELIFQVKYFVQKFSGTFELRLFVEVIRCAPEVVLTLSIQ